MKGTRLKGVILGVISGCMIWLFLVYTRGQPLTSTDVWESFFVLLGSALGSVLMAIKFRQMKESDPDQSQQTEE